MGQQADESGACVSEIHLRRSDDLRVGFRDERGHIEHKGSVPVFGERSNFAAGDRLPRAISASQSTTSGKDNASSTARFTRELCIPSTPRMP